jgi:hypothetical protein
VRVILESRMALAHPGAGVCPHRELALAVWGGQASGNPWTHLIMDSSVMLGWGILGLLRTACAQMMFW